MKEGIETVMPEAGTLIIPVGDGGEGTGSAIAASLAGKQTVKWVECESVNPFERPLSTGYYLIDETTAVIESASASGLTLLSPQERDPMTADTYGTGLLIAHAANHGARKLLVCMGGTATCDGGLGAFKALETENLSGVEITLLCDVANPFCGPEGAAYVFAPQKGATPEQLPLLDAKLSSLAAFYRRRTGIDVTDMKHAGAAGGLAGMLMACFGARPVSGISEVLKTIGFDARIEGADLIITGEGKSDLTTLSGKAPMGVLEAGKRAGIPVALISGAINDVEQLRTVGFSHIVAATPSEVSSNPDYYGFLSEATARFIRKLAGNELVG